MQEVRARELNDVTTILSFRSPLHRHGSIGTCVLACGETQSWPASMSPWYAALHDLTTTLMYGGIALLVA